MKLIATSSDKENLKKLINRYFYSNDYTITDDNRLYNTKSDGYLDDFKIYTIW